APSASSARVRTPGAAAARIPARIAATSDPTRRRPSSSLACSMVTGGPSCRIEAPDRRRGRDDATSAARFRCGKPARAGFPGLPAAPGTTARAWRVPSLQRLEPEPLGACVVAHAAALVFLVLAVVALEELHVAVALESEDVGGDTVEEPAVDRKSVVEDEGV